MGTGNLGTFKQPDVDTGNASVFLELQEGFDNASVRSVQVEAALPLADALLEGGLPVVEITFRTAAAAAVIVEAFWKLELAYPRIDEAKKKELAAARKALMGEKK